jgi:hypothetical protein
VTTSFEPVDVQTQTDAAGDVFDPEIHSAKPDGSPSLKGDGTFRKKRRDSGGRRAGGVRAVTRPRTPSTSAPSSSRVVEQQKARHAKAVTDVAGPIILGLSFVDPVDGYCAAEIAPMFAEALAGYAQESPRTAAVLDKLASAGGASALVAVAGLAFVQFASNHGKIPPQYARMLGATPRAEIEAILDQRARAMGAPGPDDVSAAA